MSTSVDWSRITANKILTHLKQGEEECSRSWQLQAIQDLCCKPCCSWWTIPGTTVCIGRSIVGQHPQVVSSTTGTVLISVVLFVDDSAIISRKCLFGNVTSYGAFHFSQWGISLLRSLRMFLAGVPMGWWDTSHGLPTISGTVECTVSSLQQVCSVYAEVRRRWRSGWGPAIGHWSQRVAVCHRSRAYHLGDGTLGKSLNFHALCHLYT